MKEKQVNTYVRYVVIVLLVLGFAVGLNQMIQKDHAGTTSTSQQKDKRLSIAVVNEDSPVVGDTGKQYQLGASYVKSLEQDQEHQWTVTSRGEAEKGLSSNKYQLMVVIPSDFSSKVLDIREQNASPAEVRYQVNSNGNTQVEVAATKMGDQIVRDLNSRLVDLYMATILENLYTAQTNVKLLYQTQSKNLGGYKTGLLQDSIVLSNRFPNLTSYTDGAISVNQSLISSLMSTSESVGQQMVSQEKGAQSLEALIQQRQASGQDFESLAQAVLEMDQSLFNEQVEEMTKKLEANQLSIGMQVGQTLHDQKEWDEESQTEKIVARSQIHQLQDQIDQLKQASAEREKASEERLKRLQRDVRTAFADQYGLTVDDQGLIQGNITVSELMKKVNPSLDVTAFLEEEARYQMDRLQQYFTGWINEEQLQTLNEQLQLNGKEAVSSDLYQRLATLNKEMQAAFPTIGEISMAGNDEELQSLIGSLQRSTTSSGQQTRRTTYTVSKDGDYHFRLFANGASLTNVSIDAGNGQDHVSAKAGDSITITYHYQVKGAGQDPAEVVLEANGAEVARQLENVQQGQSADLVEALRTKFAQGNLAIDLLYTPDHQLFVTKVKEFQEMGLNDYLDQLVYTVVQRVDDRDTELAWLAQVNQQISDLEQKKSDLEERLKTLEQDYQTFSGDLTTSLQKFSDIQALAKGASDASGKARQSRGEVDTHLESVSADLASLYQRSDSLKSSTDSSVSAAQQVHQQFVHLNEQVEQTQQEGEKIATTAQELQEEFDKELTQNGDFVEAFSTVFNNAYKDGVPNDVLIHFLSQPVQSRAENVKVTTDVYKPFTWILLLEMVALFIAYIFGGEPYQRRLNRYQNKPGLAVEPTALVTILSGVSGLVIGMASAQQLQVGAVYGPVWIFAMFLASLLLAHVQYSFIRVFRVLGMGVALLLTMTYVYLSSAIGTTGGASTWVQGLKHFHPLIALETGLSGYFTRSPLSLWVFALLLVLVVGMVMLNLHLPRIIERYRQRKDI